MYHRRFPYFVASHLIGQNKQTRTATSSIVRFSIAGIALCVAVMLLTLSIGNGFRQEVGKRLVLLSGEIKLSPYRELNKDSDNQTILYTPALQKALNGIPAIDEVRPVIAIPGILKSEETFCGVLALGFEEGDLASLYHGLEVERSLPQGGERGAYATVISKSVASALDLAREDKIPFVTLQIPASMRVLNIEAVSDIPEINTGILTLPIEDLRRIAKIPCDEVSYLELFLHKGYHADSVADNLAKTLSEYAIVGDQKLAITTAREEMPALFDWLDLLNGNISLLLIIMAIVALFTATTGVLVMILGRTHMIGVLKALGATTWSIRAIFVHLGSAIAIRGILWGNGLALLLASIQYFFRPLALDASIYYIGYVPIAFTWWPWLAVNVATFLLVMLVLYIPTQLVARFSPTDTLRFS